MKKPTKITIFNLHYDIQWVPTDDARCQASVGWCDPQSQTIAIHNGLKDSQAGDTFLHEVIHAIFYAMGLNSKSKEEDIATRLSSGLCTVWMNNPKVYEWWANLIKLK